MLPYDYARCKPELADTKCLDCMRFADHPDQTWGPMTPQHRALSPNHDTCIYISISEEDFK